MNRILALIAFGWRNDRQAIAALALFAVFAIAFAGVTP